ncbi:hypothetical protein BO94DRAFT_551541 [Aspergillus sclerotioniger CBS 115572]|uniref:Uncharacterized protein n=1 Tax=Aspergillus sclerotioniger CBS 115572 TaxID=1450535 RepID=A0A317UXC5_9EURO|nr:hypothetical protein BO94DRAFT_551541 [Aspergillus sclerotioniger CBS 115572]PWY66395.1 hypothetical protein BO94DRAFT_551541 [Aspergillus sclerotioniger CBS 115572]
MSLLLSCILQIHPAEQFRSMCHSESVFITSTRSDRLDPIIGSSLMVSVSDNWFLSVNASATRERAEEISQDAIGWIIRYPSLSTVDQIIPRRPEQALEPELSDR